MPKPVSADAFASDISSGSASALANILAIRAGGRQTCILNAAGGVQCWGDSGYLGAINKIPTDIPGLTSNVIALAVGGEHACAVTSSGGAKCWGSNAYGQLGDGTTTDRAAPVDVVGLSSGVTAITAGESHTCALIDGGANGGGIKCWGRNDSGQLGDELYTNRSIPDDVFGLTGGITAIAAGADHTCSIGTGGVQCWGKNTNGQLGSGGTSDNAPPTPVFGVGMGATAITAGKAHSCLIKNSGVKCWGFIYNKTNLVPTDVTALSSGVKNIVSSVNAEHVCAVLTSGALKCWGDNTFGELGDGTAVNRSAPTPVFGLSSGVSAAAIGEDHTCAIYVGKILCWGSNAYGQVGNGTTIQRVIPVDASQVQRQVLSISAGSVNTCAVVEGGAAACWGDNSRGQLGNGSQTGSSSTPVAVSGLTSGVSSIEAGFVYSCAVVNGGVKCWGANNSAGLGTGDFKTYLTPVDVYGLGSGSGITKVVIGSDGHTCALRSGGGVLCWGNNFNGQAGNNAVFYTTPAIVTGLESGVADISAGGFLTCVITQAGGVQCMGLLMSAGGMIEYDNPTSITELASGVKAVSAGFNFACAVTNAGGVKCWGNNQFGQLGNGTTTSSITPVDVSGLSSGVQAVSAGVDHTCALLLIGGVKCWGKGSNLGTGGFTNHRTPVDVYGLSGGVQAISAGTEHTCALLNSGRVKCWGMDGYGQLGLGAVTGSPIPVDVVASVPPVLTINYHTGQPDSFFTLTGENFPPLSTVTISVNETVLACDVPVNETGSFIIFLGTEAADPGDYLVTINSGSCANLAASSPVASVSTMLRLQNTAPLRVIEGGGTEFSVPSGVARTFAEQYLPIVRR